MKFITINTSYTIHLFIAIVTVIENDIIFYKSYSKLLLRAWFCLYIYIYIYTKKKVFGIFVTIIAW